MTVSAVIMQLAMAFAGSVGFTVLFRLRRQLIIPASLGGCLSWGIYLLAHLYYNIFFACLIASACAALYAELLARIRKAPVTLFFISAVIPLIPGSTLYYTMSYAVQRNWEKAGEYGNMTLQYAFAIAVGISLIWAVFSMGQKIRRG